MRPKTIISLTLLLFLPACIPISCTPPTINVSCSEADLIAAINDANKGAGHNTLILEEDCVFEISAVDNYINDEEGFGSVGGTGLPPILTPITIEGNNATIERQAGAPDFRILFIASTGDLTLNDLSILNGAAVGGNENGGGIYLNGSSLVLDNVVLENNTANLFGGGIYNDEGTLTITSSSINNNQAPVGAGLHVLSGNTVIDGDSTITNNTALYDGGGIRSQDGALTILGGEVTNNLAGGIGGGIAMDASSPLTYLTLDGVLFEGNNATDHGGAIWLSDSTFSIMASTFINNQAPGATGPGGGAIALSDGANGTIGNGSLFEDNYSHGFGGAISNNSLNGGSVSIYDSTIHNNSAEGFGGGIYTKGPLFISGSTISSNSIMTYDGGGVYSQGRDLIIQDSTISDNVSAQYGGGVSAYQSNLTVVGTTFQGNESSASGGGLSTTSSTIDISGGSLFDGNTAQENGGGIFNGQDSVLTIQESTVSNNQALVASGFGGGGINNDSQGTMTITTSTISGNTSAYYGGGVVNQGTMVISQSTLHDNTAAFAGGGVWGGNFSMINSTVSGNHAVNSGGGVYAYINTSITNCTIVYNTTDYWTGGGLSSYPNNTIKNSIVALNTAGALDLSDCVYNPPLNTLGENLSSDYDVSCKSNGFSIQADPLIGPLVDNGGPTWTHALLPGSPALDVATDCTDTTGSPLAFDQRFASRPGGPECDIGAYEDSNTFVPPPPPMPISLPSASPCLGIMGVSPVDGDSLRIQVFSPGLPDEIYDAAVGQSDFTCTTYPEYPGRLFCEGPRGEPGTYATLIILDPSEVPLCELPFGIPIEEVPEKPKDPNEPGGCGRHTNETACDADPSCVWNGRSGPCISN